MTELGSEQGPGGQARPPTAPVLQFAIFCCAVTMVITLAVAVANG